MPGAFDIIPSQGRDVESGGVSLSGRTLLLVLGIVALFGIMLTTYELFIPPRGFPVNHLIEVPSDISVGKMASILDAEGAIRSAFLFRVYARLTLQDRELASGTYVFEKPLGLAPVVYRMAHNKHGIAPGRVTFTEGMTIDDMARELSLTFPDFDTTTFLQLASTSEGYLFPDTYFFMPNVAPEEVFERLRKRFDERIRTIGEIIDRSGRTLEEAVIMASILEREAQSPEDMRIVAGILWDRLDAGMPLQVDAPFGYIHGENGYTPTAADLERKSPYNTYLNKGLPPTPIANPGLIALTAAVEPIETEYLYYLTGRDGQMYYGRTFEEHKKNRALYLD